jgi:hypothetical protein
MQEVLGTVCDDKGEEEQEKKEEEGGESVCFQEAREGGYTKPPLSIFATWIYSDSHFQEE